MFILARSGLSDPGGKELHGGFVVTCSGALETKACDGDDLSAIVDCVRQCVPQYLNSLCSLLVGPRQIKRIKNDRLYGMCPLRRLESRVHHCVDTKT